MKKRITLTGPSIKTQEEAYRVLSQIRSLTLQQSLKTLEREREIKQIDERFGPVLEELADDLKLHTTQLREWADSNPQVFGTARSVEWTHGKFGWRMGQPKLVKKSKAAWDTLTDVVRTILGPRFIRQKDEINKERIIADRETIDLDKMRACGLSVVQEESFFVEPKIEEAPATTQSAEAA